MFNGTRIMDLRGGAKLSEKHSDPVFTEITTDISSTTLRAMYVTMLNIRKFEERVAEFVTPPKEIICPCHLYIGEEAVAVGVCANLQGRLCFQYPS